MRGIGPGKKRLCLTPSAVSAFTEPAGGPAGKSWVVWAAEEQEGSAEGHKYSWQPLRARASWSSLLSHWVTLNEVSTSAFRTEVGHFLLVWQVEVSRFWQWGWSFLFVFLKTIIFATEVRLRQKGWLQVCSGEGLPCICHGSGLQFCPNSFLYHCKETPFVIQYLVWLAL